MLVNCKYCNKEIDRKPSQTKRYTIFFCCLDHKRIYESETRSKKENLVCSGCGVEFTRSKRLNRNSKSGLHYCNNQCKNKHIIRLRWTEDYVPKRYSHMIESLRKEIGKCEHCSYSEDLRMTDIHHIDGDHFNNVRSNFKLLCVWCHQMYHRCGNLPNKSMDSVA